MNGSDIMENINNTPKIELEQIDELEMFNCILNKRIMIALK